MIFFIGVTRFGTDYKLLGCIILAKPVDDDDEKF